MDYVFTPAKIAGLNPPAPFVPEYITAALNSIGGKTDNGNDPRLRLVWGGSETHFAYGRVRIKYPLSTKRVAIGWEVIQNGKRVVLPITRANNAKQVGRVIYDWLDLGHPYFILEEWCPPEIACEDWELTRWKRDPDTNEMIDILGPAPREGLYRSLLHLKTDNGEYLAPSERTLDYIRQMVQIRDNNPLLHDWRKRPSPQVMEAYLREEYAQIYEAEEAHEQQLIEKYTDLLSPHKHRLTGNARIIVP